MSRDCISHLPAKISPRSPSCMVATAQLASCAVATAQLSKASTSRAFSNFPAQISSDLRVVPSQRHNWRVVWLQRHNSAKQSLTKLLNFFAISRRKNSMPPTHCSCKGCDACTRCPGCVRCDAAGLHLGHCATPRGTRGAKCKACTRRSWCVQSKTMTKAYQSVPTAQPAAATLAAASTSAPIFVLVPVVLDTMMPAANTLAHSVPAAGVFAAQPAADSLSATQLTEQPAAALSLLLLGSAHPPR